MHVSHDTPIDDLQGYARKLGMGFTAIAALMAASAGYKFGGDSIFASALLAGLLGGLTIATALMLNFVDIAWSSGERKVAFGLAIAFGLMCGGEYASHVAFGTSHRAANIETAAIQNTKYDDTRDQIREGEASIKLFSERLAALEAQNSWAATVNAEALRAQEAAETRRGGCGSKCLELRAKIAVAEETGSLRKQIESTKAVLARLREKSAGTVKGDSIALNQSSLYATAFTGNLAPSATAVAWANIGVGAYLSLLSTFLGTIFNWLGFHRFGTKRKDTDATTTRVTVPDTALALAIRNATLKAA